MRKLVLSFMALAIFFGCQKRYVRPKPTPKTQPVLLVPGIVSTVLFNHQDESIWLSPLKILLSLPKRTRTDFEFKDEFDNEVRHYLTGSFDNKGGIIPFFTEYPPQVPDKDLPFKGAANSVNCQHNHQGGGLCGMEYIIDLPETRADSRLNQHLNELTKHIPVNYFADLVHKLESEGYQIGKTLFGFPYDWRQSVRHADMLKRLDQVLHNITGGGKQKAKLIVHSLGNLVVKSYLALYPENFERYIDTYIALAPPFQGAAGAAMEDIFAGSATGLGPLCSCTINRIALQAPSFFELLPSDWLDKQQPLVAYLQLKNRYETIRGRSNILDVAEKGSAQKAITYKGKTFKTPLSVGARNWARKSRDLISKTKMPENLKMYIVYGVDVPTGYSIRVQIDKDDWTAADLTCASEPCEQTICKRKAETCNIHILTIPMGDGEVPAISATTPFLTKYDPKQVEYLQIPGAIHHNIMRNETHFFPKLKDWLKE